MPRPLGQVPIYGTALSVGERHSWNTPWSRAYAHQQERPATRSHDWECLALWDKSPKEGDAFLARLRTRDVLLLMKDGPYSTCALGMRHPYSQVVPRQRAFYQGHPARRGEAFLEHPLGLEHAPINRRDWPPGQTHGNASPPGTILHIWHRTVFGV